MPGGAVEGGAANAVAGGVRRRLAGEYGAAEFITKPVDFDLLKTQLRDCPTLRTDYPSAASNGCF